MSGRGKAKPKPRGELQELQAQLQGLCTTGKRSSAELRAAKQEAFKKVVNYMTLGMDMSGLFPMMTSCANLSADDVVLKKMLYLYITHYAASTPDLVLLTINQLLKDCQDQDPTVRGLALRSLCSLRISNLLEYVVSVLQRGGGGGWTRAVLCGGPVWLLPRRRQRAQKGATQPRCLPALGAVSAPVRAGCCMDPTRTRHHCRNCPPGPPPPHARARAGVARHERAGGPPPLRAAHRRHGRAEDLAHEP
jgi:hypothetical protein